jgi:hypothetical protein
VTVGLLSFAGSGQKTGQSVINAGSSSLAFINIAKGFSIASSQANYPSLLSADGYPNTTLTSAMSNIVGMDATYYGRYQLWWTGTGCLQLQPPTIVYSGGAAVTGVNPSASGSVAFNFAVGLTGQPTQGAPVEFAFGSLITAVSTSGDSLVQFTGATNVFSQISTGATYKFNNVTGLPAGPNFDGSWTVTKIDAQNIKLQGSTAFAGLVGITGAIGAGSQSEALVSTSTFGSGITWSFLTAGTYSGFGGMVWCRKADQAAVLAGQLGSPAYVSAFKSLNPRFIRFMDFSAVQSDRSSSYTYRALPSNMGWTQTKSLPPDYYVGTITNGGSDNYTCSNPVASGAGAYAEGEIVIGQLGSASVNTGMNPTLNLNARGAKPILNQYGSMLSLVMSGTVPVATKIVSFVFTGGGLASPYTFNYTVQAGDTTFAALAISMRAAINIDATLSAKGILSQNPDVSGGNMTFFYNPNVNSSGVATLNNGMTITGSDNASSGVYTFGFLAASYLPNSTYTTFTYSKLLGGWITVVGSNATGGIHGGLPLEFYADLCNRSGVGCWVNIGIMWSDARITSTITALAGLLNKELLLELSNETWNFSLAEARPVQNLGAALGINIGSNAALNSWHGLRTLQIAVLANAAWTAAGRARSQLFIDMAYQFVDMSAGSGTNTKTYRFNGSSLNAASGNATLSAFGGYGCTAISTNYSVAPNRPIDFCDCAGGAPYFTGQQSNVQFPQLPLISGTAGVPQGWNGSGGTINAASYNGLLLASYNYAGLAGGYSSTAQQQAALDFMFDGTNGDLYNGTLNGNGVFQTSYQLANFAIGSGTVSDSFCGIGTVAASYDASRSGTGTGSGAALQLGVACYEGGLAAGPLTAGDATAIATGLSSLGGYGAGYTSSLSGAAAGPASTAAQDGTNIQTLLAAFRADNRAQLLANKYLTNAKAVGTANSGRMFLPCWYGFTSETTYWQMYPGSIYSTPSPAWNAFAAFDN